MAITRTQLIEVAQPLDAIYEICLGAAEAVPHAYLKDANEDNRTITLKVPMSVKSWGERVVLQMNEVGPSATSVEVMSKASFPLTFTDYGKNAQNVQRIVDWLARAHPSRGEDE